MLAACAYSPMPLLGAAEAVVLQKKITGQRQVSVYELHACSFGLHGLNKELVPAGFFWLCSWLLMRSRCILRPGGNHSEDLCESGHPMHNKPQTSKLQEFPQKLEVEVVFQLPCVRKYLRKIRDKYDKCVMSSSSFAETRQHGSCTFRIKRLLWQTPTSASKLQGLNAQAQNTGRKL